jgi:carotenoid cleavage dioxygenase-like enzyme
VSVFAGRGPVTLDRWTIDRAAGKVVPARIDDRHQEFPRVDDRMTGRRHRYGYSAVIGEDTRATIQPSGDFADGAFANALLKHDLQAATVQAHEFGADATAGEAVFVPAAPDAAEHDGYVLAFVHDADRGAADLVILAAQDFCGDPVACTRGTGAGQGQHAGLAGRVQRSEELASHVAGLIVDFAA